MPIGRVHPCVRHTRTRAQKAFEVSPQAEPFSLNLPLRDSDQNYTPLSVLCDPLSESDPGS
jgi:hypothetical protein